jgi:hypothetical protein
MNNVPVENHIRGVVKDLLRTRGIAKTGLIFDINGTRKIPTNNLKYRISIQVDLEAIIIRSSIVLLLNRHLSRTGFLGLRHLKTSTGEREVFAQDYHCGQRELPSRRTDKHYRQASSSTQRGQRLHGFVGQPTARQGCAARHPTAPRMCSDPEATLRDPSGETLRQQSGRQQEHCTA